MRHTALLSLFCTATLLLGSAFAAPVQLTPTGTKDTFALLGTIPIQYTYDPSQRALVIPEGKLAPNTALPEGIRTAQSDVQLSIFLPEDYQLALSPDGFRLELIRGAGAMLVAPPTTVGPVGAVASAPVVTPSQPLVATVTAPPAPVLAEPTIFLLSYASPTQVATLLNDLYGSTKIRVDERRRALVALATPDEKRAIEAFILKVDTPSPQVEFEAQVIEVNRSLTSSLGIDYDQIFNLKLAEIKPGASLWKLGEIARNPLSLSIGINLLENSGAAKVLAKPRITALDGVEARINATQTYPLIVRGADNAAPVVQNITTGISLRMLPKVTPNGEIEVQVTITVSAPTGLTSDGAPQYSSREATTMVRVKDQEPIAIGGLIEDRKIEGVKKIPGLGNIPIIGELFKKTTVDQRNTDLVIVVTPRLIFPEKKP